MGVPIVRVRPRVAVGSVVAASVLVATLALGAGRGWAGGWFTAGGAAAAWPSPAMMPASCPGAEVDAAPPSAAFLEPACLSSVPRALAIVPYADGSGRFLVASQDGQVWVAGAGTRSAQPLVDLAGSVALGPERGLLGLTLAPGFPADRRLFVDYTTADAVVVASFQLRDGAAPLGAADERILLSIPHPAAIHNGGALGFGRDGRLYVGIGDGGLEPAGGQRPAGLLGRLLRLDPGAPAGGFLGPAERSPGPPEVVASGFRNPWRFSFDAATGDLWVGDVGADAWEEVDVLRASPNGLPAGLDFGWPIQEGAHCLAGLACAAEGLTRPITEYEHGMDGVCAIVGGAVYRGAAIPRLAGHYVFGDYCSGWLWAVPATAAMDAPVVPQVVGRSTGGVAAIAVDEDGELLVANVEDGAISRLLPLP